MIKDLINRMSAGACVWLCKDSVVGEHAGITLCDMNTNALDDGLFCEKVAEALDLIREADPRRFHRVTRHIDFIMNVELVWAARYCPGNVCQLDFGRYDFDHHPEWSLYMLASTLIHEATHGHINEKGIEYCGGNRIRIEHLCREEENRFLARINSPWGDGLRRAFRPEAWDRKSTIAYF